MGFNLGWNFGKLIVLHCWVLLCTNLFYKTNQNMQGPGSGTITVGSSELESPKVEITPKIPGIYEFYQMKVEQINVNGVPAPGFEPMDCIVDTGSFEDQLPSSLVKALQKYLSATEETTVEWVLRGTDGPVISTWTLPALGDQLSQVLELVQNRESTECMWSLEAFRFLETILFNFEKNYMQGVPRKSAILTPFELMPLSNKPNDVPSA